MAPFCGHYAKHGKLVSRGESDSGCIALLKRKSLNGGEQVRGARDWRYEGNVNGSHMKQLVRTILGPDCSNHMNAEPLGIFAIRLSVLMCTR